jgi:hypothetical protein
MLSAMSRLRRLMGWGAGKVEVLDYMACIRLSDDLDNDSEGEGGGKEDSGKNGTETPKGDQGPKNVPSESNGYAIDGLDYSEAGLSIDKADETRANKSDISQGSQQSIKPKSKLKP